MSVSVEAMVQELHDKQKIHEVVMRYCRGVDRMDRALFLSCYHPDAIDDHGFVVAGPEEFWAWVNNYHTKAQSAHQHIVTNHSCELNGDVAHCETYWLFAGMDPNGKNLSIGGGRYIDRMEKRHGEWRIAARKCVPDWGGRPVDTQVSPEARALLAQSGKTARSTEDCSYERPLEIAPARVGINVDILKLI